MTSIFQTGQPQEIVDVLNNRDERVAYQQAVLEKYPQTTLLAIKLNIPGPIKNNEAIRAIFDAGMLRFYNALVEVTTDFTTLAQWDKPTGNELFIRTDTDALTIKKLAVDFEDHDTLGRLFDVDVMSKAEDHSLSRADMGLPVRKCLICDRIAKDCARSRRHSVAELQAKISALYAQEFETSGGVID